MTSTTLLPFQPEAMTPALLAAVSSFRAANLELLADPEPGRSPARPLDQRVTILSQGLLRLASRPPQAPSHPRAFAGL